MVSAKTRCLIVRWLRCVFACLCGRGISFFIFHFLLVWILDFGFGSNCNLVFYKHRAQSLLKSALIPHSFSNSSVVPWCPRCQSLARPMRPSIWEPHQWNSCWFGWIFVWVSNPVVTLCRWVCVSLSLSVRVLTLLYVRTDLHVRQVCGAIPWNENDCGRDPQPTKVIRLELNAGSFNNM